MSSPGWHPEIPSDGLTYDAKFGPVDTVAVRKIFCGTPIGRELNISEKTALYEMVLAVPTIYRDKWAGELNPVYRIASALGVTHELFADRAARYGKRKRLKARKASLGACS